MSLSGSKRKQWHVYLIFNGWTAVRKPHRAIIYYPPKPQMQYSSTRSEAMKRQRIFEGKTSQNDI